MKPKSILSPDFKYTNAASTDIRKTFARVRREQASAAKEAQTVHVVDQWRNKGGNFVPATVEVVYSMGCNGNGGKGVKVTK